MKGAAARLEALGCSVGEDLEATLVDSLLQGVLRELKLLRMRGTIGRGVSETEEAKSGRFRSS